VTSPAQRAQRDNLHTVSLRAEHVRQTRAALVDAGRSLFGEQGFADTSVDQIATRAGVTIGALYHHFQNKTELFAAVFEDVHLDVLRRNAAAAAKSRTALGSLIRGFDDFLDAVLEPAVQRIIITDAPSVLGLDRFTELDERYAFDAVVASLRAAHDAGELAVRDPETLAHLLLGALVRGGVLIANSDDQRRTRNAVSRTVRDILDGFAPSRS